MTFDAQIRERELRDQIALADSLLKKKVRFVHQPNGPVYEVSFRDHQGMIEIIGMVGRFAPHVFEVVDD